MHWFHKNIAVDEMTKTIGYRFMDNLKSKFLDNLSTCNTLQNVVKKGGKNYFYSKKSVNLDV